MGSKSKRNSTIEPFPPKKEVYALWNRHPAQLGSVDEVLFQYRVTYGC